MHSKGVIDLADTYKKIEEYSELPELDGALFVVSQDGVTYSVQDETISDFVHQFDKTFEDLPITTEFTENDFLAIQKSAGVDSRVRGEVIKEYVEDTAEQVAEEVLVPLATDAVETAVENEMTSTVLPAVQQASSAASTAQAASNSAIAAQAAAEAAAEEAEETLDSKADIDGNYSDLTAGTALELDSKNRTIDQEPYNFRTSGGTADIGNRVTEKVVGGTIGWNQLVTNGNFESTDNWGINGGTATASDNVLTVTASSTSNYNVLQPLGNLPVGHVFLMSIGLKLSRAATAPRLRLYDQTTGTAIANYAPGALDADTWHTIATVVAPTHTDSTDSIRFQLFPNYGNAQEGDIAYLRNAQLIDLTAAFNAEIATRFHSMETATAGAGVALFRKLYPLDYYAYNAGELMSVQTSGKRTVGFNQWDEEWEVGAYSTSDGSKVNSLVTIRNANPIRVLPNTTYYFNVSAGNPRVFYYDSDGSFLSTVVISKNTTFITPSNSAYLSFHVSGTTYNHDICINLSWSGYRNGEYEPYESHSYPMSPITLRGIPKWDSAKGEIYYDGDTYESDGTVTRNYAYSDMGAMNWTMYDTGIFYINVGSRKYGIGNYNLKSAKYVTYTGGHSTSSNIADLAAEHGNMLYVNSGSGTIYIADSNYSDAASFKSALSGQYLLYERQTPITETADPYTNPQHVGTTEQFVDALYTAGTRDVEIPVGHYSEYIPDQVAKLDGLPSDFSTLIAPTEASFKATKNYTVNELVIISNQLYRVTANISSGGTITVGTNVVATTLSEIIQTLLNG